MAARPDIVLLVLDTQRVDRLSCYGYPLETTPRLDAFAEDATLYCNAVSTAQWTVPSHASMFTGLYPSGHTMFHASSVLPASLTTLAGRLNAGGYYTGAFCNNPLLGVVNNGLRRDFASFLNYSGLLTSRPNQLGVHPRLFDRYRERFKLLLANTITALQDVFARSDLLLDFSFSPLMVPLWQTALAFKGNTGRSLNDAAQLLIERRGLAEEQPIFAFINLMEVHMPYRPPHRYVERFAPHLRGDRAARRYLWRFNSDVLGWLAPLASDLPEQHKATLNGMYDAEVATQDEKVGAFLEQLRRAGRLDKTLLIVCADHGEHLGEKQLMGHSIALYNELVHVPLLIRDPYGELARGTTVEHVVSLRRIFHTVLAAAGLASEPERSLSLVQGSAEEAGQSIVFAEGVTPQNALTLLERRRPDVVRAHACDRPRRAAWTGDYKFIQTGEDRYELYNIVADPVEQSNLAPERPEQVETLREYVSSFVEHVAEASPTAEYTTSAYDDELVSRRLRDLGYIE
jgi:arylsulfatase A-like enzyme